MPCPGFGGVKKLDSEEPRTHQRRPVTHLALLALAVLLVQVATVPVHDPLFEQDAPRPEQAQRIFKWVLTARVRRLQHVHHRRSICTGVLRIRAEGGKWQLEQVDLESEDRAIVAGAPA